MSDRRSPRPDDEIRFAEEESDVIVGDVKPVEDGPVTYDVLELSRAQQLWGAYDGPPTAAEVKDYVGVRDDPAKFQEVHDRLSAARTLELLGVDATEERVTHLVQNKAEFQATLVELKAAVGAGKPNLADELGQKLSDLSGSKLPGGTPFGTQTLAHVSGTANPAKTGKGSEPGGPSKPPTGSDDPPPDPPRNQAERAADRSENRRSRQSSNDDDPLPLPERTLQDQYNEQGYPDTSPSYVGGDDDGSDDSGDDGSDDDGSDDDGDDGGDDGSLTTGEEAPLDERLAAHLGRTGALRDAFEPDTRPARIPGAGVRDRPANPASGGDLGPPLSDPLNPDPFPLGPGGDPNAPIALYPEGEGPSSGTVGRGLIRDSGQDVDLGANPEGPDYGDPLLSDVPSGQPELVERPGDIGPISQPMPAASAAVENDAGNAPVAEGIPAAPDAPAPQVEVGPPGDFAAPAPGEPEGAVFDDTHRNEDEPGFNDDAI